MDWAEVQCTESHKEGLKALGISPKLAAQLVDQLGLEHAEDLLLLEDEDIAGLRLKPLEERKLRSAIQLAKASFAAAGQSHTAFRTSQPVFTAATTELLSPAPLSPTTILSKRSGLSTNSSFQGEQYAHDIHNHSDSKEGTAPAFSSSEEQDAGNVQVPARAQHMPGKGPSAKAAEQKQPLAGQASEEPPKARVPSWFSSMPAQPSVFTADSGQESSSDSEDDAQLVMHAHVLHAHALASAASRGLHPSMQGADSNPLQEEGQEHIYRSSSLATPAAVEAPSDCDPDQNASSHLLEAQAALHEDGQHETDADGSIASTAAHDAAAQDSVPHWFSSPPAHLMPSQAADSTSQYTVHTEHAGMHEEEAFSSACSSIADEAGSTTHGSDPTRTDQHKPTTETSGADVSAQAAVPNPMSSSIPQSHTSAAGAAAGSFSRLAAVPPSSAATLPQAHVVLQPACADVGQGGLASLAHLAALGPQAALIARARLGASLDLEDEQPHPDRSSSGMPAVGRLDPDRQANLQRMLRGMHGSPSQAGSPEPYVPHKYAVHANHAEIATSTAHRSMVQISHAEAQTDADASTMALEVQVEVSECTAAVEACTAHTPRHSMPTHLSDAAYQYEPDEDPEAVQGVHEWLHGDGGTDAGSPEAIHDPGVSPGNIEVPPPIPADPLYPAVECLSASQQQCLIAPQHPLLPPLILKEHAASMHGQPPVVRVAFSHGGLHDLSMLLAAAEQQLLRAGAELLAQALTADSVGHADSACGAQSADSAAVHGADAHACMQRPSSSGAPAPVQCDSPVVQQQQQQQPLAPTGTPHGSSQHNSSQHGQVHAKGASYLATPLTLLAEREQHARLHGAPVPQQGSSSYYPTVPQLPDLAPHQPGTVLQEGGGQLQEGGGTHHGVTRGTALGQSPRRYGAAEWDQLCTAWHIPALEIDLCGRTLTNASGISSTSTAPVAGATGSAAPAAAESAPHSTELFVLWPGCSIINGCMALGPQQSLVLAASNVTLRNAACVHASVTHGSAAEDAHGGMGAAITGKGGAAQALADLFAPVLASGSTVSTAASESMPVTHAPKVGDAVASSSSYSNTAMFTDPLQPAAPLVRVCGAASRAALVEVRLDARRAFTLLHVPMLGLAGTGRMALQIEGEHCAVQLTACSILGTCRVANSACALTAYQCSFLLPPCMPPREYLTPSPAGSGAHAPLLRVSGYTPVGVFARPLRAAKEEMDARLSGEALSAAIAAAAAASSQALPAAALQVCGGGSAVLNACVVQAVQSVLPPGVGGGDKAGEKGGVGVGSKEAKTATLRLSKSSKEGTLAIASAAAMAGGSKPSSDADTTQHLPPPPPIMALCIEGAGSCLKAEHSALQAFGGNAVLVRAGGAADLKSCYCCASLPATAAAAAAAAATAAAGTAGASAAGAGVHALSQYCMQPLEPSTPPQGSGCIGGRSIGGVSSSGSGMASSSGAWSAASACAGLDVMAVLGAGSKLSVGGSLLAGCHLLSLHGFQGARHSPHGMGVMHAPDNALQISTTTANTNTSSASLAHSTNNFLPAPFTTAKVNSPPEAATGAESAAHSGMPPSTFTHGQGTLGGWSVKSLPHPALLAPLAAVLAAINAGPPSLSQPASSAAAGVSSAFSSGAIPGAGGGVGGGGLHTCSVVAVAGGACVDVRKCELQGLTRSGGVTVVGEGSSAALKRVRVWGARTHALSATSGAVIMAVRCELLAGTAANTYATIAANAAGHAAVAVAQSAAAAHAAMMEGGTGDGNPAHGQVLGGTAPASAVHAAASGRENASGTTLHANGMGGGMGMSSSSLPITAGHLPQAPSFHAARGQLHALSKSTSASSGSSLMGMLTLKKSKAKGPLVAGLPPFAPVPMQHGLPLGSSSRNSSAGVAVGSSSDMLLQDDTAGMQGGTVLSGSSMPPAGSSIAAGDNGGSSSSGGVITSSMGHALADSNGFPVGAGTTPAVLLAAVCNAVVGAAALCGTGVEASGCAHVTLAASLVLGHKRHGVHLSEGAGLRMEDCRLRSNGQYGLHVGGQGSAATCLRVEVTRNDDYAVLASFRGHASLEACILSGGRKATAAAEHAHSRLMLTRCALDKAPVAYDGIAILAVQEPQQYMKHATFWPHAPVPPNPPLHPFASSPYGAQQDPRAAATPLAFGPCASGAPSTSAMDVNQPMNQSMEGPLPEGGRAAVLAASSSARFVGGGSEGGETGDGKEKRKKKGLFKMAAFAVSAVSSSTSSSKAAANTPLPGSVLTKTAVPFSPGVANMGPLGPTLPLGLPPPPPPPIHLLHFVPQLRASASGQVATASVLQSIPVQDLVPEVMVGVSQGPALAKQYNSGTPGGSSTGMAGTSKASALQPQQPEQASSSGGLYPVVPTWAPAMSAYSRSSTVQHATMHPGHAVHTAVHPEPSGSLPVQVDYPDWDDGRNDMMGHALMAGLRAQYGQQTSLEDAMHGGLYGMGSTPGVVLTNPCAWMMHGYPIMQEDAEQGEDAVHPHERTSNTGAACHLPLPPKDVHADAHPHAHGPLHHSWSSQMTLSSHAPSMAAAGMGCPGQYSFMHQSAPSMPAATSAYDTYGFPTREASAAAQYAAVSGHQSCSTVHHASPAVLQAPGQASSQGRYTDVLQQQHQYIGLLSAELCHRRDSMESNNTEVAYAELTGTVGTARAAASTRTVGAAAFSPAPLQMDNHTGMQNANLASHSGLAVQVGTPNLPVSVHATCPPGSGHPSPSTAPQHNTNRTTAQHKGPGGGGRTFYLYEDVVQPGTTAGGVSTNSSGSGSNAVAAGAGGAAGNRSAGAGGAGKFKLKSIFRSKA